MATYHRCRADGCNDRRRHDHLVCRRCWALVPEDVQAEVYGTYRRSAGIRQSDAYFAAVKAALASIASVRTAP